MIQGVSEASNFGSDLDTEIIDFLALWFWTGWEHTGLSTHFAGGTVGSKDSYPEASGRVTSVGLQGQHTPEKSQCPGLGIASASSCIGSRRYLGWGSGPAVFGTMARTGQVQKVQQVVGIKWENIQA